MQIGPDRDPEQQRKPTPKPVMPFWYPAGAPSGLRVTCPSMMPVPVPEQKPGGIVVPSPAPELRDNRNPGPAHIDQSLHLAQ